MDQRPQPQTLNRGTENNMDTQTQQNIQRIIEQEQLIQASECSLSPDKGSQNRSNQYQASQSQIQRQALPPCPSKEEFANSLSQVVKGFFGKLTSQIQKRERMLNGKQELKVIQEEKDIPIKQKPQAHGFALAKQKAEQEITKLRQKLEDSNSLKAQKISQKAESKQKRSEKSQCEISKSQVKKKKKIKKKKNKNKHRQRQRSEQKKVNLKQYDKIEEQKPSLYQVVNNRIVLENMPKKPVSSFLFFYRTFNKDTNKQVSDSNGQNIYGSQLAKLVSAKWKALSEEQKAPFVLQAQQTRQKYKKEIQAFKKQHSEAYLEFKQKRKIKANQTRVRKPTSEKQNKNYENDKLAIKAQNQQSSHSIQSNSESSSSSSNSQSSSCSSQLEGQSSKNKNLQKPTTKPLILKNMAQSGVNNTAPFTISTEPSELMKKKAMKVGCQHKPKSPSPSFFFFYQQNRAELGKKYNLNTGAKLTKVASALWKEMTDQQKDPYQQQSIAQRIKYAEQMKAFEVNYPEQFELMKKRRTKKGRQKAIQQELANQRQESNVNVNDQGQDSDSSSSSSSPEENSESQQKSQQQQSPQPIKEEKNGKGKKSDKQNCIGKKSNFTTTATATSKIGSKTPELKMNSKMQSKKVQEQRHNSGKQPSEIVSKKPKGPISSFFVFYKENNMQMAEQFKGLGGSQLVQYASQIWKNMTEQEKQPYVMIAKQSRQSYFKQLNSYKLSNPEYKQQQKKNLLQKKQRQQQWKKKKLDSTKSSKQKNMINQQNSQSQNLNVHRDQVMKQQLLQQKEHLIQIQSENGERINEQSI